MHALKSFVVCSFLFYISSSSTPKIKMKWKISMSMRKKGLKWGWERVFRYSSFYSLQIHFCISFPIFNVMKIFNLSSDVVISRLELTFFEKFCCKIISLLSFFVEGLRVGLVLERRWNFISFSSFCSLENIVWGCWGFKWKMFCVLCWAKAEGMRTKKIIIKDDARIQFNLVCNLNLKCQHRI